jgi:hypothetical protein
MTNHYHDHHPAVVVSVVSLLFIRRHFVRPQGGEPVLAPTGRMPVRFLLIDSRKPLARLHYIVPIAKSNPSS